MKVSMCERTTVCCFGVIVRNYKHAQNAKSLDGRMQMVAGGFLIRFEAFCTNTEVAQGTAEDPKCHKTKQEKNTDEMSHTDETRLRILSNFYFWRFLSCYTNLGVI